MNFLKSQLRLLYKIPHHYFLLLLFMVTTLLVLMILKYQKLAWYQLNLKQKLNLALTPSPAPPQNLYEEETAKEIYFSVDSKQGRIFSFPARAKITVAVNVPAIKQNYQARLYRSNPDLFLAFLTYQRQNKDSNYYYDGEYLNKNIPHEVNNLLKIFPINKREEEINIPNSLGIYYLEAASGDNQIVSAAYIIVNNSAISVKQDDKNVFVSSFDLSSGRSINDEIDIKLYTFENESKVLTQEKLLGFKFFPLPFSQSLDAVIGLKGEELMFAPMKLPESQAVIQVDDDWDKVFKIFLYTDRPIYKPKDTVNFRGVVRLDGDGLYSLPEAGLPVRVWTGITSKPEVELTRQTDRHGVFFGQFTVPETLSESESTQYLYASTNFDEERRYQNIGSAYFDVVHYEKPDFEIKTQVEKPEYLANEQMVFSVSGSYFDGKPLANQEVKYTFFSQDYYEPEKTAYNKNFNINTQGGMCGGGFSAFEEYYGEELADSEYVKLDQAGKTTVKFKLPDDKKALSQIITLVASKKDRYDHEIFSASKTIIHTANFNIFFTPASAKFKSGDELMVPFYAESLDGSKISQKEFEYSIAEDTDESSKNNAGLIKDKIKTDDQGKAIVRFNLPEFESGKSLILNIQSTDELGNKVKQSKYIYVYKADNSSGDYYADNAYETYLKIVSEKNSFQVGDNISLQVSSPSELDAFVSLERGRIYVPRMVHLQKGNNTLDFPVDPQLSPSITIVFTFFIEGKYHTEGLSLNIPAMHKLLQVDINPDKESYKSYESASLKITTKDSQGNPISTQLSLAIVDKAIYALRKNATPPIHSSFHYFRPSNTNNSSSLTWIAYRGGGRGGGGGGGSNAFSKLVDTLYWNPNLTTDEKGEAIVNVPLQGFTTTWKAQAYASTDDTSVGQGDTEFIAAP